MSRTNRNVSFVCVALSMACVWPSSAGAQDRVLDELYGIGVHAYFRGNHQRSTEALTRAIDEGSTDPRCFYFRGLASMRMGHDYAAYNDFEMGANFEASRSALYTVGRSLERIQGPARMVLESYRREGRIRARSLRMDGEGDGRSSTLETKPSELPPPIPDREDDAARDPFADETEDRPVGVGPAEEAPAREVPADGQSDDVDAMPGDEDPDVFGDELDPFGDTSDEEDGSVDEDPIDEDGDEEDPFGADDDETDPFGADEDETDPFGAGDENDEEEDPFGVE